MKKHDFGAWFLLCGLLFLFTPGVSAMAEETEPLFAFAAQAEEVRPGGSFAVTCTPARGDIGAFVLFADFDAEVIANAKAELPESVKSAFLYIYDLNGTQIDQKTLQDRGKSSVTLEAGSLAPGMYLYALVADGKVIDTKRMIITK